MQLSFLGATQTVTGSCYLLEADGKKILVDCGMFQGSKLISSFNRRPFLFNPGEIDAVLLTHAHIDHCGLLPKLVNEGFKGQIYSTKVTYELCSILLPDSAHIQESDAETATRKRQRAGRSPQVPIYTIEQAYDTLKFFKTVNYGEKIQLSDNVYARMSISGHIMGAALIEVFVTEDGEPIKLLFSGDVGQPEQPIIKDPEVIKSADYVIVESTYGNRTHEHFDAESQLEQVINETYERGGSIIIPAFAVGRTQVLLYYLQKLSNEDRIPKIPIIIDSPLASKATDIILKNPQEFDEESSDLYEKYKSKMIELPQLRFTQTVQESRALNDSREPMIIISASGMADAGRIVHHLKHNLWREECSILFVGYQAQGSMGRRLLEGATKVKIYGEKIGVKAKICNMGSFSAHADRVQLIDWLGQIEEKPKGFFVVHGEYDAAKAFSDEIIKTFGANAYVPAYGDVAHITKTGWQIKEAEAVSESPAIFELRAELKQIERRYRDYRQQVEQMLTTQPSKLADIKQRINRIKKFVDNIFEDL